MQISIYHFFPFSNEFRKEFELPAWPYNETYQHLFLDFLLDNRILRYEDSIFSDDGGKRAEYPFITDDNYKYPMDCFFSQCWVHPDTFKVIKWPFDRPQEAEQQWIDNVRTHPVTCDDMAWSHWNVRRRLIRNDMQSCIWEPHPDSHEGSRLRAKRQTKMENQ